MRETPLSGENKVFSTNGAGKTGYIHAIKMNLDSYIMPYTKIN